MLRAERVRIDLIMPAAGRVGFTHMPGAGDIIGAAAVDDVGQPFPYGASGKAIATGAGVVSGDYANDAGFEHDPDLDAAVRDDGIKSLIVTPLSGESGMLGVLQVGSPDVNAFGPAEVGLVEALAHQAAIAIQNARLIEALAASREEVRPAGPRRAGAPRDRDPDHRDPRPAELLQQVTDAVARPARRRPVPARHRRSRHRADPLAHVSGDGTCSGRRCRTGPAAAPAPSGSTALAIAAGRAVVDRRLPGRRRGFTHIPASDAFVAETGIRSVVVAAAHVTDDGLLGILKVAPTTRATPTTTRTRRSWRRSPTRSSSRSRTPG